MASEDRKAEARAILTDRAKEPDYRARLRALREQELMALRQTLGDVHPRLLAWRLLRIRRSES